MRFKLKHKRDGYTILSGPYVMTMNGAIEEVSKNFFPIIIEEFDVYIYLDDEWRKA